MRLLDRLKSMFPAPRLNVQRRFALLRTAISGSMSNFYMARDLQTDKVVGLKILDATKTKAFEARFKGLKKPCEGEIAVQLKHPRIVATYEYGLTVDGSQYIVMEFLNGSDMNSVLVARDSCLAGQRLKFIRQAAEAVAAVHAAGFIHRDICPRNFLMTNKESLELKLIDFGLTVPATPMFMQPGNRTGSPNYMAPELVRRRPTDQRLDVFSFGVTAYEILTFRLPWLRGTTGLAAMSHDQPPVEISQYRPQIDPVLAKAIHACIEPDVNRRCPSIETFLSMIRDLASADISDPSDKG
jgi:eukaryotic-like serine/threonine-protein kinase